ncbi:MAG: hypothetical protein IT443_00560 [Phycisphaeraceae bacterium]|nr:hypothetical protein [Phycisphaeraceae bacterium]
MSLLRLNSLSDDAKRSAYARIIPQRLWDYLLQLDPRKFAGGVDNPACWQYLAPNDRAEVHLRLPRDRVDGDFAFSLDLEEAGGGQMELSFIVVNDVRARRYQIDVDPHGRVTLLGTAGRNLPEEIAALNAGLGPCQVRPGLRLFSELLPLMEEFARGLGYVAISLEPLTYHNAVMYERHGFAYVSGYQRMLRIHQAFEPGGVLAQALDGASPFRAPELARSPRGRSWAIHDDILNVLDGEPHLELQMVKVIGHKSRQITFPLNSYAAGLD